ncbi:hypothetical protein CBL_20315 [Carabus blaptoides fortunei]
MIFIGLFVVSVVTAGFLFTRKVLLQKLRIRHVQSNTHTAPMLVIFKHQEEDDDYK